jgi:S1-C subfamily serine protease
MVYCLTVSLMLGNIFIFADAASIKDLDKSSSYAKQAISELSGRGIITGDNHGNFNPQDSITRAQMATMLVRVLGLDTENTPEAATFKDVPKNHWAFPYVEAAYKAGIVTGISQDTFGVNEITTREQMAAMFARSLGITESDIKQIKGLENIEKLSDNSKIAGWSKGYVEFAMASGLMNGTGNTTFGPKESAKREQAAVVIYRFMNDAGEELTAEQLANLEKSFVKLESYDEAGNIAAQGSGFAVADGLFATSYHKLEGSRKHIITDSTGNSHEVQGIVRYDADLDIALIKTVEPIAVPSVQAGSIVTLERMDRIIAISNPEGTRAEASKGIISEIRNIKYGASSNVDLILATPLLGFGSEGGAIFDMKGNATGIITTIPEDGSQKHVIPMDYVSTWLQELNSKPFADIPVLDMSEAIAAFLDDSDAGIEALMHKSIKAMEEENIDAYMETLHKFNPYYKEIKEELKEMFASTDFDYEISEINILEKDTYYAAVDIYYTVKHGDNPQNQEVYTIFGEYTLVKEDGRWKILLFAEELQ